ncbi:MAG: CHAP domain-containing protein [Ruminococcus sp.]
MTEKQLRNKPVKWLEKYLGSVRGSAGHKAILKVFNDSGLYPRYKMTVNDAWCATTVSVAMIASKLTNIFPCISCSCNEMIAKAKTAGIWIENDAYVPKTGDIIMYDWNDTGAGDCTGIADHVGIVVSVENGSIKIIEGNMGNASQVGYRTVAVDGKYIRGFITPDYKILATPKLKVLDKKGYKMGKSSIGVLAFKQLLQITYEKGLITAKVKNNKVFGKGTKKAVNQILKKWGYKQNGIAGEKFIKKLGKLLK